MRAQLAQIILFTCLVGLLFLPAFSENHTASAQPVLLIPPDSSLTTSVDSLRLGIATLTKEREQLIEELRQLSRQMSNVERTFNNQLNNLQRRHDVLNNELDVQFDTLRAQIPDEEPILSALFYIQYLNQRQDSLIEYVERLEHELDDLPDKHYWGVRNDFKEFDHLLLFTFLGAIMSLGLVLLLRGDSKKEHTDSTDHIATYLKQEDHIDRLSLSITLLVGSILVMLFIIFIL